MTVEQVVAARVSRRSYLPDKLDGAQKARFETLAARMAAAGVRIGLVEDGAAAFARFGKSYGMFSGVHSFFALIGRTDDPAAGEKLGYFGELLVLEACAMGLGTCWVGGTYDAAACPCALGAGEKLFCIVTVGRCAQKRGVKEALVYRFAHRGTKDLEELFTSETPVPAWFLEGMQAVRRAPSALNRQPVQFRYEEGAVSASVPDLAQHRDLDLGIAKAHFALVAGGRWEWGNGGRFEKQARGHYGLQAPDAVDALLDMQLAGAAKA